MKPFTIQYSMRLSSAIRLGSQKKPQSFKGFYDNGGTCAMAAALEAVGKTQKQIEVYAYSYLRSFPGYDRINTPRQCPICKNRRWQKAYTGDLIGHLNDDHRWTREQIADWVEQIENECGVKAEADTEPERIATRQYKSGIIDAT